MLAVHGVWAQRGALCLWAEPPERLPLAGHDADAVREALAGNSPRLAHALVARARGTVELLLPTLDGRVLPSSGARQDGAVLQGHRLPAVVLHPDRALDLLLEVAGPLSGGPGALPWPVAVGDDLRWLAAVAAAAHGRAAAGRVVPGLHTAEGEWWGRWYPVLDRPWRRWSDAAAACAPPSARAEVVGAGRGRLASEVLGHLVEEVTALVGARRAVRPGAAARQPAPGAEAEALRASADESAPTDESAPEVVEPTSAVAAWGEALRSGDPVSAGVATRELADLAVRAERWRASATTQPAELLLRIAEPPPGREEHDDGGDGDGRGGVAAGGAGWTLQVRLRSLDDPSVVTTAAEARRGASGEWGQEWDGDLDPWAFALAELGRAAAVHPLLVEAPSAPGGAGGGLGAEPDVDAPLTAQQVVDLVQDGVPALLDAGFAVALPGRWLRPPVGLSLRTRAAKDLGTSDVPAPVGARGSLAQSDLVAVDWKVVLGDVELDERELALLAEQRAPLVQLRGQWVQVDQAALAKSLRFLQRSAHQDASLTSLVGVLGQLASGSLPAPLVALDGEGPLGALLAGGAGSWAEGGERLVAAVPAPRGLRATLRPYQERGVAWLAFLDAHGLGGVLADDMGLGKTIQLLALLLAERERAGAGGAGGGAVAPTLLVCPMSVVGNWEREAATFAPDLRVHVHHGPERLRGGALLAACTTGDPAPDLVLTTYPLVARDADDLAAVPWRRVALDEAQHVKNLGTRAARAVRQVAGAPHPAGGTQRVALTGTPVENRLSELHAVLDFANPGVLGSAARFRERFSVPIEKHTDERATQLLTTLSRPFVLRRAKTDPGVAPDLPAKLELVVRANLTTEQAALYKAVVDEMLAKVAAADGVERRGLVLATLTRLKQVCNHPAQLLADGSPFLRRGQHRSGKLALVDDVLDAVVADGEKALLFTQYRELGALLVPHLRERYGVDVPFLHGGVPKAGRDAMVEQFSTSGPSGSAAEGPPIMLLSLRAGGTGLNLVAANHVVHVDRWWNPAVEAQATDRAFRIGQTRQVQVRKLVCVGTVEERVDELMARKAELASLVVGSGESWLTELSTSDLHDLVRLGAEAVGE